MSTADSTGDPDPIPVRPEGLAVYRFERRLGLDQEMLVTDLQGDRRFLVERPQQWARLALVLGIVAVIVGGGIASASLVIEDGPWRLLMDLASFGGGVLFWQMLKPRRHALLYSDLEGTELCLQLRREGVGFLESAYVVHTQDGKVLATLKKSEFHLGPAPWHLMAPDGQLLASTMRTDAFWLWPLMFLAPCCCMPVLPGLAMRSSPFAPFAALVLGLLMALAARRTFAKPKFAVLDGEGRALAAFAAPRGWRTAFRLEVRVAGLDPDLALALGTVLAMDPSGTG